MENLLIRIQHSNAGGYYDQRQYTAMMRIVFCCDMLKLAGPLLKLYPRSTSLGFAQSIARTGDFGSAQTAGGSETGLLQQPKCYAIQR
jgi:hypothetical protein